jgi:hypothetical protein
MKRKTKLKTVDPAVLKKILGGIQPVEGRDKKKKVAVIAQPAFNSFFHS